MMDLKDKHYRFLPLFLMFALAAMLTGCDPVEESKVKVIDLSKRSSTETTRSNLDENDRQSTFLFGFDLRYSPQEDARQYLPFLTYLQKTTGYRFELVLTSKGERLDEKLGSGQVHFAAIGAVSHINSHEIYGTIPLVRGLNADNRAEYQSVMVVNPNSQIWDIDDLRGKRFAFGGIDSTQGHLIPRIGLLENGIALDDLALYDYTGSHRNCADAVIGGRFDVCGMQDTMGRSLEQQGLVRIIYTSDNYPSSGVSAHSGVNPEVIAKVRRALLAFEPRGRHAGTLYNWDKSEIPNGFIAASDVDYAPLRKWMLRLGFLKAADGSN